MNFQQHNAPIYHQRSVATIQGSDMEKPFSLPLQQTYLKVVGSNPMTGTKFNCSHEGMIPMIKLTLLSYFLPIQIAHCYLDSSFLLFYLPLEYSSKLLTPTLLTNDYPIFLFHSILIRPVWVISQFEHALWVSKIPTTSIYYFCQLYPYRIQSSGVLGR